MKKRNGYGPAVLTGRAEHGARGGAGPGFRAKKNTAGRAMRLQPPYSFARVLIYNRTEKFASGKFGSAQPNPAEKIARSR